MDIGENYHQKWLSINRKILKKCPIVTQKLLYKSLAARGRSNFYNIYTFKLETRSSKFRIIKWCNFLEQVKYRWSCCWYFKHIVLYLETKFYLLATDICNFYKSYERLPQIKTTLTFKKKTTDWLDFHNYYSMNFMYLILIVGWIILTLSINITLELWTKQYNCLKDESLRCQFSDVKYTLNKVK